MKLTEKNYQGFAEIGRELEKRLERASILYNAKIKAGGVLMSDYNKLHTGPISSYFDELRDGICIDWNTTWKFGGRDGGTCFYSVKNLLDDTWEESITERAEKAIKEYHMKVEKEKIRNEKAERFEYEILKEKFEK